MGSIKDKISLLEVGKVPFGKDCLVCRLKSLPERLILHINCFTAILHKKKYISHSVSNSPVLCTDVLLCESRWEPLAASGLTCRLLNLIAGRKYTQRSVLPVIVNLSESILRGQSYQ